MTSVCIRVLASSLTTYPDVSVVCGPAERDPDSRVVTNPSVVGGAIDGDALYRAAQEPAQ